MQGEIYKRTGVREGKHEVARMYSEAAEENKRPGGMRQEEGME